MTIQHLNVQIDNLQAGAIVNNLEHIPQDTQELQSMLEEGKAKLQKALTKSLDNEQKLIRYEHDMNQQKKQLNDMENLLKVRDGLISMLKAKKDELVLENESLHRYSEEIRQLLFDTKEELKQKSELLDEANGNLEDKAKLCYKLEKKIRDLESSLSETNEKRYKLQDTVGCMEKELQSTKAHINQIAEMQTRYDIAMPRTDTKAKEHQTQTAPVYRQQDPIPTRAGRSGNPSRVVQASNRIPVNTVGLDINQGIKWNNHGTKNGPSCLSQGDNTSSNISKMYYYVPECNIQHYANYIRKTTQTASNPIYRYYKSPYYRPLTQSLVDFETTAKIRNAKRNSSPILYNSQRHAKIQTFSTPKLSSGTQTEQQAEQPHDADINVEFLVYPKAVVAQNSSSDKSNLSKAICDGSKELDPYKLCCDMLSNERADLEAAATREMPVEKVRERKEFITVVNKLSQFDSRATRDKLGLGREFTPIIFGGVSKYKVLNSGSLMWCHPSKEMQINNIIIANDIEAHRPKAQKTINNNSIRQSNSEEILS